MAASQKSLGLVANGRHVWSMLPLHTVEMIPSMPLVDLINTVTKVSAEHLAEPSGELLCCIMRANH
jgi:hypothetical protein